MNEDLFTLFTSRLASAGIDAVVTGSVAAMLYGEPRLTHDIDLVVLLDDDSIDALIHAFPEEEFYCAPEEVIRVEARRSVRGHFNIIHHATGFKADVYLAGRDPLNRWALQDRKTLPLGEATIQVASPEYVIVRKLEFFREGGSAKHIEDIRGIVRQQGDKLDRQLIEKKVAEHGLVDEWRQVGASAQ
jgi:hypothetical protein